MTFDEFKAEQIRANPQLRRSSDAYLWTMYRSHVGQVGADAEYGTTDVLAAAPTPAIARTVVPSDRADARVADDPAAPVPVVVTDLQMPFWSMVVFLVKWTLAAIPALIILSFLALLMYAALGALRQ